jgi:hypothetical protein
MKIIGIYSTVLLALATINSANTAENQIGKLIGSGILTLLFSIACIFYYNVSIIPLRPTNLWFDFINLDNLFYQVLLIIFLKID